MFVFYSFNGQCSQNWENLAMKSLSHTDIFVTDSEGKLVPRMYSMCSLN